MKRMIAGLALIAVALIWLTPSSAMAAEGAGKKHHRHHHKKKAAEAAPVAGH